MEERDKRQQFLLTIKDTYICLLIRLLYYNLLQMKQFTSPTQKTGEIGEEAAVSFLKKKNLDIVYRNYTIPGGEIDIVARENKTYLFCEVKAIKVSHKRETWPVWQNFTPAKIRKLNKAMLHFAKKEGISISDCELVGIVAYLDFKKRRARCELLRPLVV